MISAIKWGFYTEYTVDAKKLEFGPGTIQAGFFLWSLRLGDGHIPTFRLLLVIDLAFRAMGIYCEGLFMIRIP